MKLVYFASVREDLGCDQEDIAFPPHALTIADCLQWMIAADERYARAFADPPKLRFALDQRMAKPVDPISGANELAIFPPVTGGCL